jgi:selenium metabolism protein YedF
MKVNKNLLLVIKSSGIGDGEPDLGQKLLNSFLNVLLETKNIPAKIIFMATGIFLTTEGSSVIDILEKFAANGSAILSCGTCLEYYGRKDKLIIGDPTNMKDTVNAMLSYKEILTP